MPESKTDTKFDGDTASKTQSDTWSEISEHHFYHVNDDDDALLATALVPMRTENRSIVVKALIDQGSTANLITSRACQLLNLRYFQARASMTGVGNAPVGRVLGRATFEVGSIHDRTYRLTIKALVVQNIGELKGIGRGETFNWKHLNNLPLADPNYHEACQLDMLLGSATHSDIILDGLLKGEINQPIAQRTTMGWIVSGHIDASSAQSHACYNTLVRDVKALSQLTDQMKAFWELEEISVTRFLTPDENTAEETFVKTVKRASDGKFIVDLPFKQNPFETHCLGDTRISAERRYRSLQGRFQRDSELKLSYDNALQEYLTLGHMVRVESKPEIQYFIPHHPVVKHSSTTTKVRPVFDASHKGSSKMSLNECLCVGPTIQPELFDLLIRWRKFQYAITGDIEKMYRMLWINPAHADLQTILWQRPGADTVEEYKLLTATFGTSSAPFQAIRAIHEIGERIKHENAQLANMIQSCFYVDDFLNSFETIEHASNVRSELTKVLAEYGFNLRKWKSNDQRTLIGVEPHDKEEVLHFDASFKTLGLSWQPNSGAFSFKSLESTQVDQWSKRKILSEIAKLFDPLGWLAPFVIQSKILMQDIWRLPKGCDWDSQLPDHILSKWLPIYSEITSTIPITVPRWIKLSSSNKRIELHGFGDASNLAYAAAVYIRVEHQDGTITCDLLAAKTKVAPVRAITIPRMELCAASLLAKLIVRCSHTLSFEQCRLHAWSDSKIVLAWLSTHPSKWVTFVANRVSEIQQAFDASIWLHIPSKQNPADIASRGTAISELQGSNLWWHGPEFLSSSVERSPNQDFKLPVNSAPEKKKSIKIFTVSIEKSNYVLERFSDYNRLLRFTAHAMRWRNKTQNKSTPLQSTEINSAEKLWIKLIQRESFGHDIARLNAKKPLAKNSLLKNLNPFVDNDGILRMNGRVGNADILRQKTAFIMPAQNHLITLIIRNAHQRTMHGGVQLTLQTLRDQFWIIHGRNQVKKLLGKCVICFRYKKRLLTQQMAELPSFRTEQARPFTFVGCDYAGYFEVKTSERKNAPTTKGYIALFICLTTKALHLELVCDLSTAEFIMAFENFIARRRKNIYRR